MHKQPKDEKHGGLGLSLRVRVLASSRNTLGLTPSTNYKFNKNVLVNKSGK